jgi:phospholipase/lecithinase/hemolysin
MRLATKPLLLALLLAAVPFAARAGAELTVFGDSYSVPVHDGVPTWVTQLEAQGVAGPVHDFARSGAVAAPVGGNTFAAQIRRWQAGGRPLGDTVVYLGFNDVGHDLAKARAGYQAGIDALVAGGATAGGNRLILVLPHDVGSVPAFNRDLAERTAYRNQTKQLDGFIRSVASRAHATVADLFAVFDRVVADPKAEGFTNVTTADHARSRTTALYDDAVHFGQHGQAIVARTIRSRLGGGRAVAVARG